MRDFVDKVAVITGGASGIGFGMAERFGSQGMRLVLADVEEAALIKATTELTRRGFDVIGVTTDVSSAGDMENLAQATLDRFGKVHVLCNNAGVAGSAGNPGGIIWQATLNDWQWLVGVNLMGVAHGIRIFVPIMIEQDEEGHVVNTASMAGIRYGGSIYGATKAAVVSISESLYQDMKLLGTKIGVSVLCPGMTNTNMVFAERNRPKELVNEVELPIESQGVPATKEFIELSQRSGLSPTVVGGLVVEAIEKDQFYVLTHPDAVGNGPVERGMVIQKQGNPPLAQGYLGNLFQSVRSRAATRTANRPTQ